MKALAIYKNKQEKLTLFNVYRAISCFFFNVFQNYPSHKLSVPGPSRAAMRQLFLATETLPLFYKKPKLNGLTCCDMYNYRTKKAPSAERRKQRNLPTSLE